MRSTINGDASLDGSVDFADLLALVQSYGQPGSWINGDFDRSDTVDFADLLSLAQNYGGSVLNAPSGDFSFVADWQLAQSMVPELATAAALIAASGAGLRLQRRR